MHLLTHLCWASAGHKLLHNGFRPGLLPLQLGQELEDVWVVLVNDRLETPVPPLQLVVSMWFACQSTSVHVPQRRPEHRLTPLALEDLK